MDTIDFIGGGNMAAAIIGGLRAAGAAAERFIVVDPGPAQRERLLQAHGVRALAAPGSALSDAAVIVWAVKPQSFADAAAQVAPHLGDALHVSIMAGVRCAAIARRTGAARIVRAMPNTPALIGRGVAGLYANDACGAEDRSAAEAVLAPTGELLWVDAEAQLDAVTALSGSGPAYVFYVIEAMTAAGARLGLAADVAQRLAVATVAGAAELARGSELKPAQLREQVTSKGGTTAAALEQLAAHGLVDAFDAALAAAARRAGELGDALDAD
ncbi:pyrroline-5-carboxylate reductase [mine drainage metagenome]|uniref:Pyrroline-5-carboxylate reductase n=1 Tax=mine drainage metagenome TaxID=410659 RepID=A0A1J5QP97_9ZZZZ